jgi:hypothetical protein
MPQPKETPQRKLQMKLGAAGLSLSLASGASAAIGGMNADPAMSAPPSRQMMLHEEEISDVSLATFHVFDKENIGTQRPHVRLTLGACGGGGCGCGGCGCACGIGLYYHYTPPVFGGPVYPPPPPHQPVRPAHKYRHRATGT